MAHSIDALGSGMAPCWNATPSVKRLVAVPSPSNSVTIASASTNTASRHESRTAARSSSGSSCATDGSTIIRPVGVVDSDTIATVRSGSQPARFDAAIATSPSNTR